MATKGQLIDDIRERLEQYSDDSEISNLHISFLIDEARKMFIKQRYNKANKLIPTSLFQKINIDIDLESENEFDDSFLSKDTIVSSIDKIPTLIENAVINAAIKVDNGSYTDIRFILIGLDRFPYVGYNRLLPDVVYCTLGYDYKIKLKGLANRYKLLDKIRLFAIFENPEEAWRLSDDYDSDIDYLDVEYPLDSDMTVLVNDFVLKQLRQKLQMPTDIENNATES